MVGPDGQLALPLKGDPPLSYQLSEKLPPIGTFGGCTRLVAPFKAIVRISASARASPASSAVRSFFESFLIRPIA